MKTIIKIVFEMDGNMLCAHFPDFINLQESPAGFGRTKLEAAQALVKSAGW